MRYHIIIIALIVGTQTLSSQEWEVPQDRKDKLSTFEFSESSVTAGEAIYNLNCK